MRSILTIIFASIVTILFVSCHGRENKEIHILLSRWDTLLDNEPRAISDSLKTIDPSDLSRENRAYYNLLKTISDDKTYFDFKNDSLINKVVDYYHLHDQYGNNYIRALTYKGIVRTRMGITDSTVYEPLKKADNIFHTQKDPNPSIGYLLHYFLGNTHNSNASYELAGKYFQEALHNAKLKGESNHIFDAYLAIYWNEMMQSNYDNGKKYLDTLSSFYDLLPDKTYFILNARSVYFNATEEYEKALECEKKQLSLIGSQKENIDLSRLYFVVSDRYNKLSQLDSAMYYGLMAIDNIENKNVKQNYLFYENVANIAEKQQKFSLANSYRQKAFQVYEETVSDRLDTQIMEMEKKYDLSEAENIVLRSRQNALYFAIFALLLMLLLGILFIINIRTRRSAKMKLMIIEHEAERQALETKLLEEEASKRDWLIQIYGYISNRLTSLQENFDTLSQRYVSTHPRVYENMYNILHTTESDLREMPKTLIPDENTFSLYTNLSKEEAEYFNINEKIMLMLLACKADNRQISTFMNASMESVRARKSQLKKKMADKGINSSDLFNF